MAVANDRLAQAPPDPFNRVRFRSMMREEVECDSLAHRGTESFVRDSRPLSLGKLSLKRGRATLTLRATDIPGKQVADVKYLILKRPE